jgi:hypothetical protein
MAPAMAQDWRKSMAERKARYGVIWSAATK